MKNLKIRNLVEFFHVKSSWNHSFIHWIPFFIFLCYFLNFKKSRWSFDVCSWHVWHKFIESPDVAIILTFCSKTHVFSTNFCFWWLSIVVENCKDTRRDQPGRIRAECNILFSSLSKPYLSPEMDLSKKIIVKSACGWRVQKCTPHARWATAFQCFNAKLIETQKICARFWLENPRKVIRCVSNVNE